MKKQPSHSSTSWTIWTLIGSIIFYIIYFSWFTITRLEHLLAHYFDLGIMHQAVYNSYRALQTGDFSRMLEITNPEGSQQFIRMAIHGDIILALLSPFYFIFSGPQMLLFIQTVALAIGAWAVYRITILVFPEHVHKHILALVFGISYLLYTPMQRANIFDFHAVTLATPLLLFMYLYWIEKKFIPMIICVVLSLITKEQTALTIAFFALYIIAKNAIVNRGYVGITHFRFGKINKNWKKVILNQKFPFLLFLGCITWFILVMTVIIPQARGGSHFAISYYGDYGDNTTSVFIGMLKNPVSVIFTFFKNDPLRYVWFLMGPLCFFSFFAPLQLLIIIPEFAINMLSGSANMRNIIFHYTAVLQPFIFISTIYGARNLYLLLKRSKYNFVNIYGLNIIIGMLMVSTIFFSITKSPLPYSFEHDDSATSESPIAKNSLLYWMNELQDETIKISSTGKLGPYFSSRRYFYIFSSRYELADYVIIYKTELENDFRKEEYQKAYADLIKDTRFEKQYGDVDIEVYRKISLGVFSKI
ncbi:MAG: DUF2079 domain-containing protein [Candidatus Roizmanbacteria bacterium]